MFHNRPPSVVSDRNCQNGIRSIPAGSENSGDYDGRRALQYLSLHCVAEDSTLLREGLIRLLAEGATMWWPLSLTVPRW